MTSNISFVYTIYKAEENIYLYSLISETTKQIYIVCIFFDLLCIPDGYRLQDI